MPSSSMIFFIRYPTACVRPKVPAEIVRIPRRWTAGGPRPKIRIVNAQGLPLIAAGIVLILAALRGREGRLARNGLLGIRLPSTMRSDAAWDAAHRASWLATFLAGTVALGGGLALTLAAVGGSVVLPAATSSILILLLIGTIQADRAARNS
jgi:hypothetical protein